MPDPHSTLVTFERDKVSKEKIKGEIVNFILRTAREFATRQTQTKVDPDM